jgi:Protein of unknown function (DUF3352)
MRARLAAALLLVGVALGGCGSGDPSGASPAPLAPAKSLVYLEVTVRPTGTQRTAVEGALTRLLGHSPDASIQSLVGKALSAEGLSYGSDIQPWLGQRIGIVVTQFSRTGVGLVAPTSDPGAALKTFRRVAHVKLVSATYAGVHYQQCLDPTNRLALGIVGHDAVLAGPTAFREIVDAYHGRSLARSSAFGSAFSAVRGTPLIKAYVNATGVGAALRTLLQASPALDVLPSAVQQLYGAALAKLHGTLGLSLTATAHALTIDVRSSKVGSGHGGDVSSLPEQSWLALATGAFNLKPIEHVLTAELGQNPSLQLGLSSLRAETGLDLLHDVLPALGPLELSFQGTSALAVAGGLVIHPAHLAAAGRVLAAVHRLVSRSASLSVHGTAHNFTITERGVPIPRVVVTQTGGKVVVTLDESPAQALAPPTHLSASRRFAAARNQLPPGSRIPLFVDFRGLGQLLQGLTGAAGVHDESVVGVLSRLDYLVLGSNPTQGDLRLVLALR